MIAPKILATINNNTMENVTCTSDIIPHTTNITVPTINSPKASGWKVSDSTWNKTGIGLKKYISKSPFLTLK